MKKSLGFALIVVLAVAACLSVSVSAQEVVDAVVAVVGDEIILLSELQKQLNSQMMARNLDMDSPRETLLKLRDEILEGMVDDRLLIMKAQQDSIEIDAAEVDRELKNSLALLRQRYPSEDDFQKGLEEYGLTEVQLRNMYSDAIAKNFLIDRLRMDMGRHISVTPQELDAWIAANKDSLPTIPERFKLSHILVYPDIGGNRSEEAKKKLLDIRQRILNGEDFGKLAGEYSDDPGTKDTGGYIDYFSRDSGYDPDFTTAAFSLKKGEISGVVESIYGYHLIKCEDIRRDTVAARHILLRLTPDESDELRTVALLDSLRSMILDGKATFEDIAKKNSQDENSRDLGGKLDWITSERGMSDSGIPSFIMNARKLKKDEISEPFKSQFGYHIIRLDDYQAPHVVNVKDDRLIIENVIRQKKFIEEYDRIIADLRSKIYIDIRLN